MFGWFEEKDKKKVVDDDLEEDEDEEEVDEDDNDDEDDETSRPAKREPLRNYRERLQQYRTDLKEYLRTHETSYEEDEDDGSRPYASSHIVLSEWDEIDWSDDDFNACIALDCFEAEGWELIDNGDLITFRKVRLGAM
jgi:hypothetical protein